MYLGTTKKWGLRVRAHPRGFFPRFRRMRPYGWERARRGVSGWRWLGFNKHPLLVVAVSAAVAAGVAVAFAHLAGDGRVFGHLDNIAPLWFVVCLVAEVIAYGGYVVALRSTARVGGGPRLGLGLAARVVAAGFGAFFAASAAGGFQVDYWAFRRSGASRRDALARVLGLGTLEYAVLAPAALVSALALFFGAGRRPYPALTLPWLLVLPGFAFAVFASSPERSRRWSNVEGKGRIRSLFGHAVSGIAVLRRLVTNPIPHGGLAVLGTSVYWFGEILCLWASLRAFQADVRIPALILAYASGYVVTRRALPAGGVGVAEIALTFALVWLGVPFAPALLGVFSYRIFNFWLALLPALAVGGTMRRIREGMPQADRELARERP